MEKENILDHNCESFRKPVDKKPFSKFIKFIFIILSSLVWIANIVCLSYWIRATIHLGWVPSFDNPDPGNLGWSKHYNLVGHSLNSIFIIFFFWLASLIAFIITKKKYDKNKILMFGISAILISTFLIFGDFFEWWLD